MIHHLSIPATDTRHVADVLVELLGGVITGFGPYPDSWIAWAGDKAGAAIEVYPVHATVSVERNETEILALAAREGWRALRLPRGPFDVTEFWVENTVMLELMTPEMTAAYLASTPRAGIA